MENVEPCLEWMLTYMRERWLRKSGYADEDGLEVGIVGEVACSRVGGRLCGGVSYASERRVRLDCTGI